MSDRSKNTGERILILLVLGLFIVLVSIMWMAVSGKVGWVYRGLRNLQTLGLWKYFSSWGPYFYSVSPGQNYNFLSLYKSSIMFGIANVLAIMVVCAIAYMLATRKHIHTHVTSKKPLGPKDVMRKLAPLYPHNDFFLHFDLSKYSQKSGIAATPMTSHELLRACGAVTFDGANVRYDHQKIRAFLIGRFGIKNPFRGIYTKEAEQFVLVGSPEQVEKVVAGLPWHVVVVLYPLIARLEAALAGDQKTFLQAVKRTDEFIRDIWRDIMSAVHSETERTVVLGLDYPELTPKPPIALADLLASKAEDLRTVQLARTALAVLAGALMEPDDLLALKKMTPVGEGNAASRRAIAGILAPHAFLFGPLASALVEARRFGVVPPNLFLWMRFVDPALWRFVNYVGMATPSPEASGIFEHWRAEVAVGDAIDEPFVESAPIGIEREANNYIWAAEATPDGPIPMMSREENAQTPTGGVA